MGKVLLIGNSGDKSKSTDGQITKVRLYRDLIIKEGADLVFVDLENFAFHPLKILLKIKKGIRNCDRIILITAQRGSKILIPFVNFLNKRLNKPFIFPMIGINILHKYVDKLDYKSNYDFMYNCNFGLLKPTKSDRKNLSRITMILPENDTVSVVVKNFFNLQNVEILNNFRCSFNLQVKTSRVKENNQLRLIFLSRVTREKGVFELIRAVNELLEDGCKVKLDIFGKKYFDEKENAVFESQLNSNIQYKGVIDNSTVIRTISNYDVFVFPTLYKNEGTPGVISEALIAGVPIISSNFTQVSNLLKNYKDSLIYDANNINDLKNKIRYFLNKDQLSKYKINASISGQRFNYEYNRDKFLKFILGS